jgi:hypothetical protein
MLNQRFPQARPLARRALSPGPAYYWLAFAFFVVAFGIIPFSIYADSGDDWGFPYYQTLYISVFGLIVCLATFIVIRLIALVHVGAAATLACILFCAGVFLLLAHVYAPVELGPLDGSEMVSAEPMLDTIVEVVFAAALVVMAVGLMRGRGRTVASWFSLALVLVALGYVGAFAYSHHDRLRQMKVPSQGAPSLVGNVYHIVLDSMQTDAFLAALERGSERDAFTGFELFANNISNYVTTVSSSASYFTGRFYQEGDYKEWSRDWRTTTGLLPTLSTQGYTIWMYSPFPQWKNKHTDRFWYNVDIYEQESGFADAGLYDLIHIWLLSLVPNVLTNEALQPAARLRDRIFEALTGKARPLAIRDGLHPYAGTAMLRHVLREEDLRAPNGQYVYAHAALPHGPFVMDRDCRYVGKRARGQGRSELRRTYLDQAECAVHLVADFLDRLRRLGRYDPATIVVHADTGSGFGFVNGAARAGRSATLGTADETLLSSVNALLMIKRPQATGPLRTVATRTQLVDLYPTILDILGLEADAATHGKSVYAIRPEERREARFAFDPNEKHGPDLVEVRIEDQVNLPHSKLTVLGPATDPASWRDQAEGSTIGSRPDVTLRGERR